MERLLAAALHYRFIAPLDRELCASDTGVAWLDLAPQQRWEALRELFLAELSLSERAFLDQGTPSVEQTLPLADAATSSSSAPCSNARRCSASPSTDASPQSRPSRSPSTSPLPSTTKTSSN